MKNNRRSFLRNLGIGSGALLVNPVFGMSRDEPVDSSGGAAEHNAFIASDVFVTRNLTTDFLVAGGGMAGVCAALAAARNGMKVIFIQNRSRLGGNASSEIRMHICGASQLNQVWRESGLLEEILLTEAAINPQRCWEMLDYVMYDKVLTNPNITLLFDTSLYEVVRKGKRIESIKAYCSQTEEIYDIKAQYFADCTGDGTLAALAAADFMRGREAKSEYNEPLGLDKRDDITMGNSLLFQSTEHDRPMPFKAPSWARKYQFEDFKHRKIHSWEYGYWWIELGGLENIVQDGQKIRHDLMAVVFGVWDYIKNSGNHPESANWALSWHGAIPGKRESRRIKGDYVLTQNDVLKQENFEDRVAYGGWPLDDHLPAGMDDTSLSPFRSIGLKGPYSIPLRCLYSNSVDNLVMAGRNISVTHVALSTTRVMATCATLGQAIGTAVAFAVNNKMKVNQIVGNKEKLQEYQQLLLRQDQAILNIKNLDKKDLALLASITASSESDGGLANLVTDGINRDIADGKLHQWRAAMSSGEQFLELKWKSPQELSLIEFTFDTGLNRHLRLSGENGTMKNQVRGPQPETISDYQVECYLKDRLLHKIECKDNFLRKVAHSFNTSKVDRVRFVAKKTHGDKYAKVFEIRCYA
nr:FAD-dependent oxidoreductase [uncultured Sphingobacterium sp.]